jgi:hypothetical protein
MSEMTLFKGGIPAHLKNAELDEATKALMGKQNSKQDSHGNGKAGRTSIC